MLTYSAFMCSSMQKKKKKNTAESKHEKKIAEKQVIFSSYKADSFQML